MKIILAFFLTLVILPLSFGQDYSQPVEMPHKASDFFKIYPIGWSSDGNFAFISLSNFKNPGEKRNCYQFIIQSAESDEILYKKTVYKQKNLSRTAINETAEIKVIWKTYYSHFKNMLIRYGIKSQEKIAGGNSPAFSYKNRTYGIKVTHIKSNPAPGDKNKKSPAVLVDKATVLISSESLGKKSIFSYSNKPSQTEEITDSYCAGYIQSPLEERVVVIYIEDHLEGGKKTLKMIGAHLTMGFKK